MTYSSSSELPTSQADDVPQINLYSKLEFKYGFDNFPTVDNKYRRWDYIQYLAKIAYLRKFIADPDTSHEASLSTLQIARILFRDKYLNNPDIHENDSSSEIEAFQYNAKKIAKKYDARIAKFKYEGSILTFYDDKFECFKNKLTELLSAPEEKTQLLQDLQAKPRIARIFEILAQPDQIQYTEAEQEKLKAKSKTVAMEKQQREERKALRIEKNKELLSQQKILPRIFTPTKVQTQQSTPVEAPQRPVQRWSSYHFTTTQLQESPAAPIVHFNNTKSNSRKRKKRPEDLELAKTAPPAKSRKLHEIANDQVFVKEEKTLPPPAAEVVTQDLINHTPPKEIRVHYENGLALFAPCKENEDIPKRTSICPFEMHGIIIPELFKDYSA